MGRNEIHRSRLSVAALTDEGLERRLWKISLALGIPACLAALILGGLDSGLGFLSGAVLSWINFRWLKQGVDHLLESVRSAQPFPKRAVRAAIFKYFLRYALIGLSLYATFRVDLLEVFGFFSGLVLLVGAVLVECVLQVIKGWNEDPCHGTP
ncbi:MAG: ATP synthase subunit I [Acidobacteriota bacterium]|nr:ATP synthase subunit I [Acidobacteriota bacterium]MDE2962529.1 ATP synthase subunit I [Acidobacteriota bacterium]